ncbi:MAG: hypothetical protein R2822_27245 [Spirosomataceae bacterium]
MSTRIGLREPLPMLVPIFGLLASTKKHTDVPTPSVGRIIKLTSIPAPGQTELVDKVTLLMFVTGLVETVIETVPVAVQPLSRNRGRDNRHSWQE